jgi:hypothetical protein
LAVLKECFGGCGPLIDQIIWASPYSLGLSAVMAFLSTLLVLLSEKYLLESDYE